MWSDQSEISERKGAGFVRIPVYQFFFFEEGDLNVLRSLYALYLNNYF